MGLTVRIHPSVEEFLASAGQFLAAAQFVLLFTDLANPTSNKIYQAIGYEPVCDVDEYRFRADA